MSKGCYCRVWIAPFCTSPLAHCGSPAAAPANCCSSARCECTGVGLRSIDPLSSDENLGHITCVDECDHPCAELLSQALCSIFYRF